MVYTGFGQRGLLSPSKGVLSGTNYLNQGYRNYTTRRNADIILISIQIDPNILTMLRLPLFYEVLFHSGAITLSPLSVHTHGVVTG